MRNHMWTTALLVVLGLSTLFLLRPQFAAADAWEASSAGWSWAEAHTDTIVPAQSCDNVSGLFVLASTPIMICLSPNPPAAQQAYAEAQGRLFWGGHVVAQADGTGLAGVSEDGPSVHHLANHAGGTRFTWADSHGAAGAPGTAMATLEVVGANYANNVLTATLAGSVTKYEVAEQAEVEFLCFVRDVPQDDQEAGEQPITNIFASGLVRLPRGSFAPTVTGVFTGIVTSLPTGISISGTINCNVPQGTDPARVVAGLRADATGADVAVGGVGGIMSLPDVAALPLESPASSGPNAGLLAGVAAAITAGMVTLGGAAWYARRRWLR